MPSIVDLLPAGHHIGVCTDIVISGRSMNPLSADFLIVLRIDKIVLSVLLSPTCGEGGSHARQADAQSDKLYAQFFSDIHVSLPSFSAKLYHRKEKRFYNKLLLFLNIS